MPHIIGTIMERKMLKIMMMKLRWYKMTKMMELQFSWL